MGSLLDAKSSGLEKAKEFQGMGSGLMGKTQPNIPMPKKTIAGGGMSMLGGAGAGAAIANAVPAIAASNPLTASVIGLGALLGGGQYFGS